VVVKPENLSAALEGNYHAGDWFGVATTLMHAEDYVDLDAGLVVNHRHVAAVKVEE
jgi:hypothetical protein